MEFLVDSRGCGTIGDYRNVMRMLRHGYDFEVVAYIRHGDDALRAGLGEMAAAALGRPGIGPKRRNIHGLVGRLVGWAAAGMTDIDMWRFLMASRGQAYRAQCIIEVANYARRLVLANCTAEANAVLEGIPEVRAFIEARPRHGDEYWHETRLLATFLVYRRCNAAKAQEMRMPMSR